jgi:hypothetical protein
MIDRLPGIAKKDEAMSQPQKFIHFQASSGPAFTAGPLTVTPHMQTLTGRWPAAGWRWSRPVSVTWQMGEQSGQLTIIDLTRLVQLSLLSLSVIFFITGLIVSL